MFSRPVNSDVKGLEKGQEATKMDPTSQMGRGGNAPTAGPQTVDGSSIGMELDELTLDVLLVSLRIAHRRLNSVDSFFNRTNNYPFIPQVPILHLWISYPT